MANDLTAGPALECDDCEEVFGVSEAQRQEAIDCPFCGGSTQPREITECSNGQDCDNDNHDFGRGVHVEPA